MSSADAPPIVTNPTWSPDGTQIAIAYTGAAKYRIVTTPAFGTGPTRIVYSAKNTEGCCDPMLWAAGGRILFIENFTLTSLPTAGGKPAKLFSSTPQFILSPNGATAAVDDGCACGGAPDAIGLVNVRGGKPLVIPKPARAEDVIDGFSPDGTELVFSRGSLTGKTTAKLMAEHVGGGAPVPLGKSALIGASFIPAGATDVQWSPDGRWIAFVLGLKLEVVSTAGDAPPKVLATHFGADAFSWSPDSTRLAYGCCSNHQNQQFFTVAPDGTHPTVLWTNPSLHYISEDSVDRPQWSPDGSKLVFLARSGPGYPPIQVWTVGADGTGLKRIA